MIKISIKKWGALPWPSLVFCRCNADAKLRQRNFSQGLFLWMFWTCQIKCLFMSPYHIKVHHRSKFSSKFSSVDPHRVSLVGKIILRKVMRGTDVSDKYCRNNQCNWFGNYPSKHCIWYLTCSFPFQIPKINRRIKMLHFNVMIL